ncbi:LNS2 domain-containing protein [Actinoplanes sp. CA-252034]|uniref:phosphatase domain-containing protein n=1 Tax=Actinoplanes sp. CA-252034 TaxID=3239906 RepID=UPI003D98B2BD
MPDAPFAVFDVDGVVADVRHRLRHVARQPKDWARFFSAADRDPPLPEGTKLVHRYVADHQLVWLTGRPEWLRPVTERWFERHGLPAGLLLMRPDDDRRPARDFKLSQLRRLARDGEITVIVDDDPAVVKRLKTEGFPVRLADWVPYERSLRQAQERDGRT